MLPFSGDRAQDGWSLDEKPDAVKYPLLRDVLATSVKLLQPVRAQSLALRHVDASRR